MTKIILPNLKMNVEGERVAFLFGPIRNAPNWHDKAINFMRSANPDITIASPRRTVEDPWLRRYIAGKDEILEKFPRQRAWEWHYQEIAAKKGVLMFWLPGEDKSSREYDPNKVYGAMTRIELGQWMTRYKFDNSIKMCFGSDGHFPELHTIAYDLSLHIPNVEIKNTLEETCAEASRLLRI